MLRACSSLATCAVWPRFSRGAVNVAAVCLSTAYSLV
jgi:hypothetical protein